MNIFKKSAGEFKNIRSLVGAALLIALHTVFACFVSIQVTSSLRISISFIINVAIGAMYGPVFGFVCGGLGDIIQFLIKPTGPYFVGWTISAALAGLIYGMFFYNRQPAEIVPKAMTKGKDNAVKAVACLLHGATFILWLFMPVFAVDGECYTGITLFTHLGFSGTVVNAVIIGIIVLTMCIISIVLSLFDKFRTAFFVDIIGTFATVLAAYTDKKTISMQQGFLWFGVLMAICLILLIYAVSVKHTLDLKFLGLCTLALTFDTVLINILLGTYWVTTMYGKGFAFYFTSRLIKNMVQLPINIMLTYYFLGVVKKIKMKVR